MIYKFQPYAFDRNKFGNEYNAHCAAVPNDSDWILILDFDCMILSRLAYGVMERAIDRYPDTEIFGARCNRVGYSFQRLTFGQDENDSIKYHTKVADDLAITYSSGECNDAHTVAGFFMLFRKSYWNKVKFQDTIMDMRGNLFDYNFVLPAFKAGNKIRIIKGVYCWHSYRIMQENIKSKEHLKI